MVPGHRAANGVDAGSVDRMFAAAYQELRQLAARVQLGDPGRTLSPTALVNEAWLKLVPPRHWSLPRGAGQDPARA
jgi:hypothetical protein